MARTTQARAETWRCLNHERQYTPQADPSNCSERIVADAHAHMRKRKQQNIERSRDNRNENWLSVELKATRLSWTRQATWGFRVFDFWCAAKGISVEVDGWEHDKNRDSASDVNDFKRSGIIVLRIKNGAHWIVPRLLAAITGASSWNDRRAQLGLDPVHCGDMPKPRKYGKVKMGRVPEPRGR